MIPESLLVRSSLTSASVLRVSTNVIFAAPEVKFGLELERES